MWAAAISSAAGSTRRARQIVRTAVDAISAPAPKDRPSPARRRADGLIELCRRYLDSGALPQTRRRKTAHHSHHAPCRSDCDVGYRPADRSRGCPPARLRRQRHSRRAGRRRTTARYRPGEPHNSAGNSTGCGGAGQGLHSRRLRQTGRLVRRPLSGIGSTVATPRSTTSACSATSITGGSITAAGRSPSSTGFRMSSRPRSSTLSEDRGAIPCTTRVRTTIGPRAGRSRRSRRPPSTPRHGPRPRR